MLNSPQNYIIFYSKRCKFSEKFLNKLYSYNVELYKNFKKIDIDTGVKLPKYVTILPTIIIPDKNSKQIMYAADNAFKWLESMEQIKKNTNTNVTNNVSKIEEFDPFQMNGFSTNYSSISNSSLCDDESLPNKNYFNVNANSNYTLGVSAPKDDIKSDKIKEDSMNRTIEDYKAQRELDIQQPPSRQGGIPQTPNFQNNIKT